jgi:hypothetical protein
MTDYEIVSVLNEFVSTTWAIFATYVSIVFAFLVASYLVASRLVPRIVAVVIILYTLVALWAVWGLNRTAANLVASIAEIKRRVQEDGSSLGWLPATSIPDVMLHAVPFLVTTVAVVAFVGSVVFFFHQRKWGKATDRS